jgi:hypothetical protein
LTKKSLGDELSPNKILQSSCIYSQDLSISSFCNLWGIKIRNNAELQLSKSKNDIQQATGNNHGGPASGERLIKNMTTG